MQYLHDIMPRHRKFITKHCRSLFLHQFRSLQDITHLSWHISLSCTHLVDRISEQHQTGESLLRLTAVLQPA